MAYETQTKEAILDRMLALVNPLIDKAQGSIVYDMQSPAAIEIALAYIELDRLLDQGFADTTFGELLDRRVGEMGITRKAAVKSAGQVTFAGTDGTVIPAGTVLSTESTDPVYFTTNAAATIAAGSVSVAATEQGGGVRGNVAAGEIKIVVGDLAGSVTVSNAAAFIGGVDAESDESLLLRYYDRVRTPGTSGNANQYKEWAKEIAGIADAKVYPVWNGAGTVKVVLLDGNQRAPTAAKVTEVADHIEAVRPIGATVTVQGVVEVPIDVVLDATIASYTTLEEVTAQLTAGLKEYLSGLAFKDPLVRYTQVQRVVLDVPEIVDYVGLTVNGGTSNIEIADGSVAVLGTVTVT